MNNKIMDNKINFNNTYSYAQILSAIRDLRENGLPKGYSLGIPELDERITLDKGKLCTISGMPNLGKSEFTDFICTQLNKLHGFKTLFFSAEDTLAMHVSKLIQKYKFEGKTSIEEQAKFLSENFGFIDYDKVYTIDKLMKVAEEEISCKKYDVLVIDPFNKFDAEKPYNVNMTDYISKFLDKLIRFTKRNNIITLLVAHPRKPYNKDIPSAYDIADSAHFYNKSDYCIIVHGDTNNFTTKIRVEKVKYKHLGIKGEVTLHYDDRSGNFYYEEDELDYIFGKPQPVTETTTKDYLDIDVNYFNDIKDTEPKTLNLKGLLFGNNSKRNNELVEKIRKASDKKESQELKQGLLNFAINCRFKGRRGANNVSEKTGLIYIDIDFKDNTDIIDDIPNILKSIQNIVFYKKSCSGKGYQAIIPYFKSLDFTKVWYSIEADFKELGIVIDSATKDISRVTFYSYDPDYYYNPNAELYIKTLDKTKEEKIKIKSVSNCKQNRFNKNLTNSEYIKKLIAYLDANNLSLDNDDYSAWEKICLAIISEFGESGIDIFKRLSLNSDKYDEDDTEKFYTEHLSRYSESNRVDFGTIKYYAKQIGFE